MIVFNTFYEGGEYIVKKNVGILFVFFFICVIVVSMNIFVKKKKETDNSQSNNISEKIDDNSTQSSTGTMIIESDIEIPNSNMSDEEIYYAILYKGIEDIENNGVVYSQEEIVSYGFLEYKLNQMIIYENLFNFENKIPNFDEDCTISRFEDKNYQEGFEEYKNRVIESGKNCFFVYVSMEFTNKSNVARDKFVLPRIIIGRDYVLCGEGDTVVYLTGTSEQEENHQSYAYLQPGETRRIDAVIEVSFKTEEIDDIKDADYYVSYENAYTTLVETPINETDGYILIQGNPEFVEEDYEYTTEYVEEHITEDSTYAVDEIPEYFVNEQEMYQFMVEKELSDIKGNGVVYKQTDYVTYGFVEYEVDQVIVLDDLVDYQNVVLNYNTNAFIDDVDDIDTKEEFDVYIDDKDKFMGRAPIFVYVSMDITNKTSYTFANRVQPNIIFADEYSIAGYSHRIRYFDGLTEPSEYNEDYPDIFDTFKPNESKHIEVIMEVYYATREGEGRETDYIVMDNIKDAEIYIKMDGRNTTIPISPINETDNYILIQCTPEFE